jgi:hypothetical protein
VIHSIFLGTIYDQNAAGRARTSLARSSSREDSHQIGYPQHDIVCAVSTLKLSASVLGVQNGASFRDRQRDPLAFFVQMAWADGDNLSPTNGYIISSSNFGLE